MEDVALYLKQLRFKKKMFGGIQETDLWRKLEQLHREYLGVFAVQEALYEEQLAQKDARIAKLEELALRMKSRIQQLEQQLPAQETGEEG